MERGGENKEVGNEEVLVAVEDYVEENRSESGEVVVVQGFQGNEVALVIHNRQVFYLAWIQL